jgi:cell division protein FtsL
MEISNSTPQTENPELQTSETLVQAKNISRRKFMKLSLEERRYILAAQADLMLPHYEQDIEWQELQTGDLIDY